MATVQRTAVPVIDKRAKRGRPRKPFDYVKPEQSFRDAAVFAEFLAGYPDMSGVLAYIYRLKPKLDLSRIGITENSIWKTSDPEEMTGRFCGAKWGRGLYYLKLTDGNRQGPQEVAKVWFTCDDPELGPPVYDVRTLLINDPANADEVARLLHAGVLVRDNEFGPPRIRTEGAATAAKVVEIPVPVAAPAVALGGSSLGDQLVVKLLDLALPSAKPQTAADVLDQSFKIADRMRPAASDLNIEEVIERVMTRLQKQAPPTVMNEIETWERMNGLLEKLNVGRGSDAPAPVVAAASGWAGVLGPILQTVLQPLVPVAVAYLGAKTAQAKAAAPAAAAPAPTAPVSIPAPLPSPSFLPADAPLLDRIQQVAQLAMLKQAEGVAGFDFAAWLNGFYPGGKEVYSTLEAAGGTAGVMGMLAMQPDLAPTMEDPIKRAALESWLEDFFSYDASGGAAAEQAAA